MLPVHALLLGPASLSLPSHSPDSSFPTLATSWPFDCLCANGCLPKREQRNVPALPGVAFLVPHSYSGVKRGLQL